MKHEIRTAGLRASLALVAWVAMAGCSPEADAPPGADASATGARGAEGTTDASALPDWALHVASHTSGDVSKKTRIRVRFVAAQVPDDRVGSIAPDRLSFEPRLAGTARWKNRRLLEFEPREALASATAYRAQLSLRGLVGFPADYDVFPFEFRVISQDFAIQVDGLSAVPGDPASRVLSGVITTADSETAERVEGLLSAKLGDEAPAIEWEHDPGDRRHRFRIAGVERRAEDRTLVLAWNGTSIDLERSGTRDVRIPARDCFDVAGVRAVEGSTSHIRIEFSDELDPDQSLAGLIRVAGRELRLDVDGNLVRAFSEEPFSGDLEVRIEGGIRNRLGARLEDASKQTVTFAALKPAVRFVGTGTILPPADEMSVSFEAVGVRSVQLTLLRVYEENIGRFLQSNPLAGDRELTRVGRYVWRRKIDLGPVDPDRWQRFAVDAKELFDGRPDGLLQLTLQIDRSDASYACAAGAGADGTQPAGARVPGNLDAPRVINRSYWDFYEAPQNLDWRERDDPCTDSYYRWSKNTTARRNLLASNLGLLAKRGTDNDLHVVATDLSTGDVAPGTELIAYNYQGHPLGRAKTDSDGIARLGLSAVPFYVEAHRGDDRGFLRLAPRNALSTSDFDVGGQRVKDGIKGHLYGERGVWRPGDAMHLVFVLEDGAQGLPDGHPVSLTLFDPKGREAGSWTRTDGVGNFYSFDVATPADAPTGRWTARTRVGGSTFERPLRVEAVVPNRLRVKLDFGESELHVAGDGQALRAELRSEWLHGAPATELETDVSVQLRPARTAFASRRGFRFDDPASHFAPTEPKSVFSGRLDAQGFLAFDFDLERLGRPPGKLVARFTTRVHERGGGFSTDRVSLPFHPYERYVGVKTPEGDDARNMLLTDTLHRLEIATLDSEGRPVSVPELRMTLHKLDWRWWWAGGDESENLARFVSSAHHEPIARGTTRTTDGEGSWSFRVDHPAWGRYLLRACDGEDGHCGGQIVYIDWPGWAGRARQQPGGGAAALSLSTDRSSYSAGSVATVTLPAVSRGRALVSLETASELLDMRWVDVSGTENRIEIPITEAMAPTTYVSVALVQPHVGRGSDRPLRLYGYVRLEVEAPQTRLHPELGVARELRPGRSFPVKVSERDGRAMSYTVAIVDEGLLGLTRFRTPDLHAAFYRREGLGVRTWDVFDDVIGAHAGRFQRMLAVGGDAAIEELDEDQQTRRFPAVVRFLGPFALAEGEVREHDVALPDYLGAVRLMLVAGAERAYGSSEQSVPVRDTLMLLASLPRGLGPGEEVRLPATVFATRPGVGRVRVVALTDGGAEIAGEAERILDFTAAGDRIATFRLRAADAVGSTRVSLEAEAEADADASGGGPAAAVGAVHAEQQIDLPVRARNPVTTAQWRHTLDPGETWTHTYIPHGMSGTNRGTLEVSTVPPFDLQRRLDYLVRYPHGCVEQVSSAAFPQLYLDDLLTLDPARADAVESNVGNAIIRLRHFQRADGSFSYWPGGGRVSEWASLYAGHFLLEAQARGYFVPASVVSAWRAFQRAAARAWTAGSETDALVQAYRLYALALADVPEVGAMNRLRESPSLGSTARWLLASAYEVAGLPAAATRIVAEDPKPYAPSSVEARQATYGSQLRDDAVFLLGLSHLRRGADAQRFVGRLSAALVSDKSHSTQSTAFALLALARFAAGTGSEAFTFDYQLGSEAAARISSARSIHQSDLGAAAPGGTPLQVTNHADKPLFLTLTSSGVPPPGGERASSRGLQLDVRYQTPEGQAVDPTRLEQGSDLVIEVEVTNTLDRRIENVAVQQLLASGFEVHNARFGFTETTGSGILDSRARNWLTYQDVRDDRVSSYFDLRAGQSRTLRVLVNAAWAGRFYLPAVSVEAMYEPSLFASTAGRWIQVEVRPRVARAR